MRRYGAATLAAIVPWLLPIGLIAAWELAAQLGWLSSRVLPAPSATARAFWETLRSGALPHHVWVSTERAVIGLVIGGSLGFALGLLNGVFPFAERLLDSSLQMLRNIPASGGDPPGHPLVRDRRAGQAVPGRRRRAVPDLPQHLPRHPPRRPRPGRDGPLLRAGPMGAVQPGHPARRLAVHPGRPALRARHHVADADRRRDDLGLGGHRLHDHERPRVPADRRRPARASSSTRCSASSPT